MKRLWLFTVVALVALVTVHAANPSFESFDTNDFVALNPTIRLRNAPSSSGTNTYITNLFVTQEFVTNLTVFETNFVNNSIITNLFVSQSFITNLFVTYEVVGNIVSGNIQGPLGFLPKFGPDTFSLEASIAKQTDTNTIAINAGSDLSGFLTLNLGLGNDPSVFFGSTTNIFSYKGNQKLQWKSYDHPLIEVVDNGGNTLQVGVGSGSGFISSGSTITIFGASYGLTIDSANKAVYPPGGGVGEVLGAGTNYFGGLIVGTNSISSALGSPDGVTLTWGGSGLRSSGITKAQKTALTPVSGTIVYQTDNTPGLRAYIGGTWFILSTGADP